MKISKNLQKGFTYVELTVILVILLILFTLVVYFVNPLSQMKKSRDEKRLSDISTLERAINEFVLDSQAYPDQENTLRTSTTLPSGSLHLNNSNLGWISANLSPYLEKQPTDPLNNNEFFYSYFQVGTSYEINAKLEFQTDEMLNDGGNDPDMYETGNNLNLISP